MGVMKTMKRTFLISAFVLAFITGCVSNDVYDPEGIEKEIRFTSPAVSIISKAYNGEINSAYPTEENFTVWAVYHEDEFEGWATNAVNYMLRAECAYDATYNDSTTGQGGWSTSKAGGKAYYWPKDGVLTFAGYSPADAHNDTPVAGDGTGKIDYGPNGLTITDFSVHGNAASQRDLMYSERAYNKSSSSDGVNTTYDGVDLTFHHALSSIRFKVQKKEAYPGHDFKLLGIKICNVESKGDFQENITNETTSTYFSTPAWTLDGVINDYGIDTDELPITLYGTNNYHEVAQGLILMPQIFKEGSTIVNGDAAMVIDYQVTVSSIPVEQTATVKLNTVTDRWEMGKRYIYNITLGYDTITVSPTVPGWVDVNVDAAIK